MQLPGEVHFFKPQMHQKLFGSCALPRPTEELTALPLAGLRGLDGGKEGVMMMPAC